MLGNELQLMSESYFAGRPRPGLRISSLVWSTLSWLLRTDCPVHCYSNSILNSGKTCSPSLLEGNRQGSALSRSGFSNITTLYRGGTDSENLEGQTNHVSFFFKTVLFLEPLPLVNYPQNALVPDLWSCLAVTIFGFILFHNISYCEINHHFWFHNIEKSFFFIIFLF